MTVCDHPRRKWGYTKTVIGGDVVFAGDEGLTLNEDAQVRERAAQVRAAKLEKHRRDRPETLTDLELARLLPLSGDEATVETARVTPEIVRAIRRLRREGLKDREISRRTGVPSGNCNRIGLGKSWGHVRDEQESPQP